MAPTIFDIALYVVVAAPLGGLTYFMLRRVRAPAAFVRQVVIVALAIVFPVTVVAVAMPARWATVLLIVMAEEAVRAWAVIRRPAALSARALALTIGLLYGLIETTNWLFTTKARAAIVEPAMPGWGFVAADVGYILTEFAAGLVIHGILTLIMVALYGKSRKSDGLWLAAMVNLVIHYTLNFALLS